MQQFQESFPRPLCSTDFSDEALSSFIDPDSRSFQNDTNSHVHHLSFSSEYDDERRANDPSSREGWNTLRMLWKP